MQSKIKGLVLLALLMTVLYRLEPIYTVIHNHFDWSLQVDTIELPRFYLTREEAIRAHEEKRAASSSIGTDEQPVQTALSGEQEWALMLVNSEHTIPREFRPELATVQQGEPYQVDVRIVDDLRKMIQDAQQQGVNLQICSAYRSYDRQKSNLQSNRDRYKQAGYTDAQAWEMTNRYIAPAGGSEHQTGLAVDIVTPSYQILDSGYANTAAAKWLLENAADYGFILRYPRNKEEITGIWFEPWHYRYVGQEAAEDIMAQGICLEEYLGQIPAAEDSPA